MPGKEFRQEAFRLSFGYFGGKENIGKAIMAGPVMRVVLREKLIVCLFAEKHFELQMGMGRWVFYYPGYLEAGKCSVEIDP